MISDTSFPRPLLVLGILIVAILLPASLQPAFAQSSLSCGTSNLRHDWDVNSWPPGSLVESYTTAGETLSINIGGDNTFFQPSSTTAPITSNFDTGGIVPAEQSLELFVLFDDVSRAVNVTFDVGVPGEGVEELEFSIFDVDNGLDGANSFIDQITVTGSLNGASVTPTLLASAANTVSGNVATGQAQAVNTSADGNVRITFSEPIDQFVLNYTNGPGTPNPPTQQAVSIHDIFTCPRLLPDISINKSVSIYDPNGDGLHNVPGNDVIYTISASNSGTGSTDPNSIVLIDALPSELTFFNGDIDDGGPELNPVIFSQTNSPSLTFTYPTDVAFSNAATRPSDFSACSYSPVSGYDPSISYVCFNPKGEFEAGAPAPTFSVEFRTRIK